MPKAARPQNRKPATPPAGPAEILNKRWFAITNLAGQGVAEIKLRGYIGEPKQWYSYYDDRMIDNPEGAGTLAEFEAELEALGDVKNLQLSIFSQGGDWATGVAIHNLLIRHPANKVCIIDGLCSSAATYPAMACQEIRIPSNASMLIHEASNIACGTADDLRAAADNLDSITNSIAELYAARTGKDVKEIRNLMKEDRYLDGNECLELGLADTLIEPLTNLAQRAGSLQPTNLASLQRAPAEVLALFDMRGFATATRNSSSSTMKPKPSALLNAASDPAAPAGGQAGGSSSPAAAPAAPAAAAPTNVAPPAPAAAPAAPAAAAPTNVVQLTQEQLQGMINTAVTNAVTPLQTEITRLSDLNKAGISPQNLGGAQPATNVAPAADAPKTLSADQIKNMSAAQLISFGRANTKATLK